MRSSNRLSFSNIDLVKKMKGYHNPDFLCVTVYYAIIFSKI